MFQDRLIPRWDMLRVRMKYANGSFSSKLFGWMRSILWPTRTVLFFPERPPYGSVEFTLGALLGYAMSSNPHAKFDVAVKRKDATFFDSAILGAIPGEKSRIINAGSVDISKRTLARVFRDVFGYTIEVDPSLHHGQMVEKSNRNSAHDGRIVTGPLSPDQIDPRLVYQKLIDNSSEKEGLVLDLRLPVFGDQIPFVYLKYRPVKTRFANRNTLVDLAEPTAAFSRAELEHIVHLARRMGMDYGEYDVLRDKDGRIYVVDANNTPFGPPNGLSPSGSKIAVQRMAQLFDHFLEQWSARSLS